jgi:hypothetical protein
MRRTWWVIMGVVERERKCYAQCSMSDGDGRFLTEGARLCERKYCHVVQPWEPCILPSTSSRPPPPRSSTPIDLSVIVHALCSVLSMFYRSLQFSSRSGT